MTVGLTAFPVLLTYFLQTDKPIFIFVYLLKIFDVYWFGLQKEILNELKIRNMLLSYQWA